MKISAAKLARLLGGHVQGDEHIEVYKPARIEDATPGSLSFFANPKYEEFVYTSKASIILVSDEFVASQPVAATLVRVKDVYGAMATLAELFGAEAELKPGISKTSVIDDSSAIAPDATISDYVVIGPNCQIGKGVKLHPFVYLGPDCIIGAGTVILPGVKIHRGTRIGERVCIHANSVIGSDGFGYVKSEGSFRKMKQLGHVVIEDDVEIGANVVIDRASLGATIIREGSKLDNLIQIAHNVDIGKHTAIAAQSGVAGSSKIGNHVLIGGQVGIVGHIEIADGTQIQAQSGVTTNTKEEARLYGSPALPYTRYLKSYAVFRRLPDLATQINVLQKRLHELEKQLEHLQANS